MPGGTVAWLLLSASVDAPAGFLALAARWSYSLNEFDAGVMATFSDKCFSCLSSPRVARTVSPILSRPVPRIMRTRI